MGPRKDIINQKFNRLTAIKCVDNPNYNTMWLFRCDCGKEKVINKYSVLHDLTKSCGCLDLELKHKRCDKDCGSYKHGFFGTRFYEIWRIMKKRCSNKHKNQYKRYSGRGIEVCDRWNKFENFRDDMYESYLVHVKKFGEKNTTIDRIDNDGNYELNNCRWSTLKEQARNRSNNTCILYEDKSFILQELSDKLNIRRTSLKYMIVNNKINAKII